MVQVVAFDVVKMAPVAVSVECATPVLSKPLVCGLSRPLSTFTTPLYIPSVTSTLRI